MNSSKRPEDTSGWMTSIGWLKATSRLLPVPQLSTLRPGIGPLAAALPIMHTRDNELAEHHRPLAETSAAGQSSPPLGNGSRAGGAEHGLRGRAGEPANPSRDTRPERATRFIETTRGVLSYSQLAPLLAGQVVAVQADAARPHRRASAPKQRSWCRRCCSGLDAPRLWPLPAGRSLIPHEIHH